MSSPPPPASPTPTAAPVAEVRAITSSSVPDLAEVRTWLETMIKALKFVELVVAILALIGRMRDINLDLVKQIAHARRARPRSTRWISRIPMASRRSLPI